MVPPGAAAPAAPAAPSAVVAQHPPGQPGPDVAEARIEAAAERVINRFGEPHMIDAERQLIEAVEAIGIPFTHPVATRVLARVGAVWWVQSEFERIFGIIYGSQIDALRRLNSGPALTAELEAVHQRAIAQRGLLVTDFSRWITFLVANNLVEQNGDVFSLNGRGHSFLLFLVRAGKPDRIW